MDADIFTLLLPSERIEYLLQIYFPFPIYSLFSCLPLSRFINLSLPSSLLINIRVVRYWGKMQKHSYLTRMENSLKDIRFIAPMIRVVLTVRHTAHQCDFLSSMAARWQIWTSPFLFSLQLPYNHPAIYTAIMFRGSTAHVRVPPAVYTVLKSELSFVYTGHQPEVRYSSLCSYLTHRPERGEMRSYFS